MISSQILNNFSLTLLLVICLIVTFKSKFSNGEARRWLALYFWANFYALLVVYLFNYGYGQYVPHLRRTVQIAALLIFPVSYFYILQQLYPRKFRYTDLLHLLPTLFFVLDYLPFFLLSGAEKMAIFEKNTYSGSSKIVYAEAWLMPAYGHFIMRYVVMFSYLIAQVVLINRYNRSKKDGAEPVHPILMRWIKLLTASQFIHILFPLPALLLNSGKDLAEWINVAALLALCIQCYFLVFHPQVLYGDAFFTLRKLIVPGPAVTKMEIINSNGLPFIDDENAVPDSTLYSEEMINEVGYTLDELMKIQQPFLKQGYRLKDLSRDTDITVHKLSAYINQRAEMNYSNYINELRIKHFIYKLKLNEHQDMTLESLARDCGFQYRSTFCRAFKNFTGSTVSEYLKKSGHSIQIENQ